MFNNVPGPETPAEVDNKIPSPKQMSAEALNAVGRGVCCGIIRSLVQWLYNNNADRDDIRKKIYTFVNAMRSNNDITDYEQEFLSDGYLNSIASMNYAMDADCAAPICSPSYLSWYTIMSNVIDDMKCYEFSFDGDRFKNLNEHERKLITALREASDKYYTLRNAFEEYFRDVNKRAMANILVKYGTVLSQIAPQWYKDVIAATGVIKHAEDEREEDEPEERIS